MNRSQYIHGEPAKITWRICPDHSVQAENQGRKQTPPRTTGFKAKTDRSQLVYGETAKITQSRGGGI